MGGFAVHCYFFCISLFHSTIEDFLIQYLCASPNSCQFRSRIIFLSPMRALSHHSQVSQLLTKEEKDAELRAPTSGYKA